MGFFFLLLCGLYLPVLALLILGWYRAMTATAPSRITPAGISVIIAARNEGDRLPALLRSILRLNYPREKFEVIVVDDHSTDNTHAFVKGMGHPSIRVVRLQQGEGKKAAITEGIAQARFDLIVTTDADCVVPRDWLLHVNESLHITHVKMAVGPVRIRGEGFFASLQAIEFCSVIGATGAALGFGAPSMCNGANLAYWKQTFLDVSGYAGNEGISSGDDEFLMRKVNRLGEGSIRFINHSDAVVTTTPHHSLREFLNQRLRWAGKWKPDFGLLSTCAAVVVWLIHVSFIGLTVLTILGQSSVAILAGVLIAKLVFEAVFLFPVAVFLQSRWNWISFVVLQFVYSPYVVLVGFLSLFVRVRWKGRVVKTAR